MTSAYEEATQPASSHAAAISLSSRFLIDSSNLAESSSKTARTLSARVPFLPLVFPSAPSSWCSSWARSKKALTSLSLKRVEYFFNFSEIDLAST